MKRKSGRRHVDREEDVRTRGDTAIYSQGERLRRKQPTETLTSNFHPPGGDKVRVCCLSHPACGVSLRRVLAHVCRRLRAVVDMSKCLSGMGGARPAGVDLRGLPVDGVGKESDRALEGPASHLTFIALRSEDSRKALKQAGRKTARLGIWVVGL